MDLNDVRTSKFLRKEDVGAGVLATIDMIVKANVALEGAETDEKVCLHFTELPKPLVLNSTNAQIIAKITGQSENIEKTWIGTKIVLYNDPNVSYGGKLIGGIRVRAPKGQATQTARPDPDLPF
jgi:hypothetical protein